ncbi:NAD(P)H-dependent oxidoreductase [Hymenobacter tibetensis]|uniref:NAD(P)H-dependent oxidoreductase n=1 Tax=Hymenobacter tibetensis TaxID=497967 RepID=A0ABY4D1D7_9BACT|nr:NAD(P)H-dependent oxidoreductase [Hymenobacter tibetensis]UOG76330.1 NAD(P)H-dependent oxidoreductase [Hymenobacter tibetensis]
MITVIAGTNRPTSRARHIANLYISLLQQHNVECQLLDLALLPDDVSVSALYHNVGNHDGFNDLAALASTADKLVMVVPEYNCSYPGVLKTFIDGLPYPGGIRGKKAALIGLSSGGQGGLLALSHLTDVLMYLGTAVLPARVRLPFIDKHLNAEGNLSHPLYMQLLQEQVEQLIAF